MTTSNAFLPETVSDLVQFLGLIPHPEGGFFVETFRSGATPMESHGQTDYNVSDATALVATRGREQQRPDGNPQRNALTSIYWCPTVKSPLLGLVSNRSDHVHYYQGGLPFEYHVYNTVTKQLQTAILGPDLSQGHVLQLPVSGGKHVWKCGTLLTNYNDSVATDDSNNKRIAMDYSIISEAVGPGFDFYDFHIVTMEEFDENCADDTSIRTALQPFVRQALHMTEIDAHYDDNEKQETRTQERI